MSSDHEHWSMHFRRTSIKLTLKLLNLNGPVFQSRENLTNIHLWGTEKSKGSHQLLSMQPKEKQAFQPPVSVFDKYLFRPEILFVFITIQSLLVCVTFWY